MGNELKIAMHVKGDTATIGISKADCDPVFSITDGPLTEMLGRIPSLVEEAEKKWQTNPRYPQAEIPEPDHQPVPTKPVSTEPVKSLKTTTQEAMF